MQTENEVDKNKIVLWSSSRGYETFDIEDQKLINRRPSTIEEINNRKNMSRFIRFKNRRHENDPFLWDVVDSIPKDDESKQLNKGYFFVHMYNGIEKAIGLCTNFEPFTVTINVPKKAQGGNAKLNRWLKDIIGVEIDCSIYLKKTDEFVDASDHVDFDEDNNGEESDYFGCLFYNSDLRSISGHVENVEDLYEKEIEELILHFDSPYFMFGDEYKLINFLSHVFKIEIL